MAKKIKIDDKKEIKKVEDVEDTISDFEEYDDEDEVEVTTKIEKDTRDEKETDRVIKNNSYVSPTYKDYLTIASFVISIISLILLLVVLAKIDNNTISKGNAGDTTETESVDYDTSMFTEIDEDKFVDLINNKKGYSFVYTGRSTCGYCLKMIGNYQQSVSEYDYELYYLDTSNLTSDFVEKIQGMDEIFENDFPATPMVYLVGKGEVKDVNEGYTEYSTYANFLEDNGVDKK